MKILNLYGGIGGNRKLWGDDHEITTVEWDENIVNIYRDFFPNDNVVVGDAHQYLLDHFMEYDFIWTSPPCPTHSRVRKIATYQKGTDIIRQTPVYPDMKLYEEILLLQGYYRGLYCVENVRAWYKPLVEPQDIGSHWFWANFTIPKYKPISRNHDGSINDLQVTKGFDISKYTGIDKRKTLRNCVEPETGLHIFNAMINAKKL